MHAQSWGTLLSLAKLHLNVINVISHPLWLLLTLYQLSLELSASLHLQKTADNRTREVTVCRQYKFSAKYRICIGHRKPRFKSKLQLHKKFPKVRKKLHEKSWPYSFPHSAAMWLTSLWSCACSTCFWLSKSSSSSLRAFCSLRSSICTASCSLDGLPKSERGVIRVKR